MDRVRRVTEGFRLGRGCVDQIFTLNYIDEKAREKKTNVVFGFYGSGKGV